jgi:diguanylate cyclase (GGDEF)-like protein
VATLTQEYQKVQGEATMDTLRRVGVVIWVAIPMHLSLGIWFGLFTAPAGRPDLHAWANGLMWTQVGAALGLSVLGLLNQQYLKRNTRATMQGIALQSLFCAVFLTFGATAAVLDVSVGYGIATFLIVCQGIAVLSLMRPIFAGLVFGIAFIVFLGIVNGMAIDPTLQSSVHIQAGCTVLLSLLVSQVMWHQYTRTILLSRQLSRSNEALLSKQQELEVLAQRDALTGLYNRRQFTVLAEMALARLQREPGSVCLLMVDLDFFKKINDQHGHPAGDEVLQQVAAILTHGVRATDMVGRIGGEEFIVLLPYTTLGQAMAVAEKLRSALDAQPLMLDKMQLAVTASFGVTGVTQVHGASLQTLYSAADDALYAAKHGGRNRVECALPDHITQAVVA